MDTYIEIYKEDIPYEFNIVLDGKTYEFLLAYNTYGDFFTCQVSYQDVILGVDKVLYGRPLFTRFRYKKIPPMAIYPASRESKITRVTYENFGEEVQLWVGGDIDEIMAQGNSTHHRR